MNLDYNALVSGSDIDCDGGVILRQPVLDEIRCRNGHGIGFAEYYRYMYIVSITDDTAQEMMPDAMPPELKQQITAFVLTTAFSEMRESYMEMLAFYTNAPVRYVEGPGIFETWNGGLVTQDNFGKIRNAILVMNGLTEIEVDRDQIKNAKVRALFDQLAAGRKQMNQSKKREGRDKNRNLYNLLSALSGKGYGYNLLNVWDLTVWQFYDQFRRVNVNSYMDVASVRWAAYGKEDFDYDLWYRNDRKE